MTRLTDDTVSRLVAERPTLAELERAYIYSVLEDVGGNKAQAARVLGFDRRTLYRKLERYAARASRSERESSRPNHATREGDFQ